VPARRWLHEPRCDGKLLDRVGAAIEDASVAGMSHQDLVDALRALDGLDEVSGNPPNFHYRSRPFLHFHQHSEGTYADVRFGRGDFEPVLASTPQERLELLARVCDHIERLERSRKSDRRSRRRSR
jgi:hypothetical protein